MSIQTCCGSVASKYKSKISADGGVSNNIHFHHGGFTSTQIVHNIFFLSFFSNAFFDITFKKIRKYFSYNFL